MAIYPLFLEICNEKKYGFYCKFLANANLYSLNSMPFANILISLITLSGFYIAMLFK